MKRKKKEVTLRTRITLDFPGSSFVTSTRKPDCWALDIEKTCEEPTALI